MQKKKLLCYVVGQSHRAHILYSQNMIVSFDPFANKLTTVAHHHKLVCLLKGLLYCVQSQGHSKGSRLH